ncbi:MAG: hypothetical protein AABZ53_08210, partial [Planctomycetota bacterium]
TALQSSDSPGGTALQSSDSPGGTALQSSDFPRGTALQSSESPGGPALQSGASPSVTSSPTNISGHSPKTYPTQPAPRPTDKSQPTAKAVLMGMLKHLKNPESAPVDGSEPFDLRFAQGATIDHKPIPTDCLDDPELLADLLRDSTLSDILTRDFRIQSPTNPSDTSATFPVLYPPRGNSPSLIAYFRLTRDSTSSPWCYASISSTSRPTPTPCASSP